MIIVRTRAKDLVSSMTLPSKTLLLVFAIVTQALVGCGVIDFDEGANCTCPKPAPPPAFPTAGIYERKSATDLQEQRQFSEYLHASTLTTDVKMEVSDNSLVIRYMYGTTHVTEKWRIRR